jgi:hypothetical protein
MSETWRESWAKFTDVEKLEYICDLIKTLQPEFKAVVIKVLAEQNTAGETQVIVTSNEQLVRMDFGRPLAWFAIPKAHAMQLGITLMTHAGAQLEMLPHTITVEKPPDAGSTN